jgi:hypothetical protein
MLPSGNQHLEGTTQRNKTEEISRDAEITANETTQRTIHSPNKSQDSEQTTKRLSNKRKRRATTKIKRIGTRRRRKIEISTPNQRSINSEQNSDASTPSRIPAEPMKTLQRHSTRSPKDTTNHFTSTPDDKVSYHSPTTPKRPTPTNQAMSRIKKVRNTLQKENKKIDDNTALHQSRQEPSAAREWKKIFKKTKIIQTKTQKLASNSNHTTHHEDESLNYSSSESTTPTNRTLRPSTTIRRQKDLDDYLQEETRHWRDETKEKINSSKAQTTSTTQTKYTQLRLNTHESINLPFGDDINAQTEGETIFFTILMG